MLSYNYYYGEMNSDYIYWGNTVSFNLNITDYSGSIRTFTNLDLYLYFPDIGKYIRVKNKENTAIIYTEGGTNSLKYFIFSDILNYNSYDIYYDEYQASEEEGGVIVPIYDEGSSIPITGTKITSNEDFLSIFPNLNSLYGFQIKYELTCIDDSNEEQEMSKDMRALGSSYYIFFNKFIVANAFFSTYNKIYFSTNDLHNQATNNFSTYMVKYIANTNYSSSNYTIVLWYKIIHSEKNYYYFNKKFISDIESPYTPVLFHGDYDPSYRISINDANFMYNSTYDPETMFSLSFNTLNNLKSFPKAWKIIFKVSVYNETETDVKNKLINYNFDALSVPVEEYISEEYDLIQLDISLSNYSCITYITQTNNNIQKDYYSQESNNYKFNLQYKNDLIQLNNPIDKINFYLYGGAMMQEEEYKKLQFLKDSFNFVKPFYQRWHQLEPYSTEVLNSTNITKTWSDANYTSSRSVTFTLKKYRKEYHYYLSEDEKFALSHIGALPEQVLSLVANKNSYMYKREYSYKNSGEYVNSILNNNHFKMTFKEIDFDYIRIIETYEECYQWQPTSPYYKVIDPTEYEYYYKYFFTDLLDETMFITSGTGEYPAHANDIITKTGYLLIPGDLVWEISANIEDVTIEDGDIPTDSNSSTIDENDENYECSLQIDFIKNDQVITIPNTDARITYRNIYVYPQYYYYIEYPIIQDGLQENINVSNLKQTHTEALLSNPGDAWFLVTENYIMQNLEDELNLNEGIIGDYRRLFPTEATILTINNSSNSYFNINETSVSIGPSSGALENSKKKFEVNSNYDAYFNGKTNIFPVGSIYLSLSSQNPSLYFIGEWIPFGQGRTLIGADGMKKINPEWTKWWRGENALSEEPEMFIVDKYTEGGLIGGEETHTLTIDEMPSHKHSIREEYGATANGNYNPNNTYSQIAGDNAATKAWVDAPISETGGDLAHNNMPPYITCYMWLRIA